MNNFFDWLISLLRDAKFWFSVRPWEKGVLVHLGKYTKVSSPGFHWKWPVLDEVYMVNTRLRLAPATTQTVSTNDGKIVTLGLNIGFSISNPLQALATYQHPENSVAVLCHNYAADYIISKDSNDIDINELSDYILCGLRESDPNDGINPEFVKVTNFILSSPARTIRLVQDEITTDRSSEVFEVNKTEPNVFQW